MEASSGGGGAKVVETHGVLVVVDAHFVWRSAVVHGGRGASDFAITGVVIYALHSPTDVRLCVDGGSGEYRAGRTTTDQCSALWSSSLCLRTAFQFRHSKRRKLRNRSQENDSLCRLI